MYNSPLYSTAREFLIKFSSLSILFISDFYTNSRLSGWETSILKDQNDYQSLLFFSIILLNLSTQFIVQSFCGHGTPRVKKSATNSVPISKETDTLLCEFIASMWFCNYSSWLKQEFSFPRAL